MTWTFLAIIVKWHNVVFVFFFLFMPFCYFDKHSTEMQVNLLLQVAAVAVSQPHLDLWVRQAPHHRTLHPCPILRFRAQDSKNLSRLTRKRRKQAREGNGSVEHGQKPELCPPASYFVFSCVISTGITVSSDIWRNQNIIFLLWHFSLLNKKVKGNCMFS